MTGGSTPALNLIVMGLITAGLWGASDFLGGVASRRAHPFLVVALAHGVSLLLLLPLAFVTHSPLPNAPTAFWGLLTGLTGGVALIVFYEALALGSMGLIAALAGLLTAIVPIVFSSLTEGLPHKAQLLGFGLAVVAIWLIAYVPGETRHPRGLGLAAIAGIGFGAFLITSKYASQGRGLIWPLAYSRMVSASLASAMLLWVGAHRKGCVRPLRGGWAVVRLAAVAGVLEAAGNLVYMATSRMGRLDIAAILASLYPATTILLAAYFLKERTSRSQALGMALAMGAVVLISL